MFTREQGHTGNRQCTLTGGTRGHFGCDDGAHTEEHEEKACHELCEGTSHLCVRDVCTCVRLSDCVCTGVVCMRQLKPATTSLKKNRHAVLPISTHECVSHNAELSICIRKHVFVSIPLRRLLRYMHMSGPKARDTAGPRTSARRCKNTKYRQVAQCIHTHLALRQPGCSLVPRVRRFLTSNRAIVGSARAHGF